MKLNPVSKRFQGKWNVHYEIDGRTKVLLRNPVSYWVALDKAKGLNKLGLKTTMKREVKK